MPEFKCARCGNCCRPHGHVRLQTGETERIAEFLKMELCDFIDKYTRLTDDRRQLSLTEKTDIACIFLSDAGLCLINDVKPKQCRDFPGAWTYDGVAEFCRGKWEP